jgi:hypothetical protein
MNDASALQEIADHLNEALNVVPFAALPPQTELERLSSVHRRAIAKYSQRIADTRKHLSENLAKLESDRKAELDRHEAEIRALDERRTEELARAEKDIAADQRLSASCRAALAELDEKP